MKILKEFPKQLINDRKSLKKKKCQDHGYPWEEKRTEMLLSSPLFPSPEKRTKGEMSRRHLFSPPSLNLIISQPRAYPAGHVFIG